MRHGNHIVTGEDIDFADLLEDALDQRQLRDALNRHRVDKGEEMREAIHGGHSLQEIHKEWASL